MISRASRISLLFPKMVSEKQFPATTVGLADCQKFLSDLCQSPRPQIIMDEIVSNIVRCSGATSFVVRCEHIFPNGVVAMTFIDDGKPFDPTKEIAEPNIAAKLEDRDVGGLGIFMVKKMSKSVAYIRDGEQNRLSVTL